MPVIDILFLVAVFSFLTWVVYKLIQKAAPKRTTTPTTPPSSSNPGSGQPEETPSNPGGNVNDRPR